MCNVLHHILPSNYKPSSIAIPLVLFKIWPGQATLMKKWLRGDNSINIQVGSMVLESALPCIVIYLYTKFDLNATSSFKVICQTKYPKDRWTKRQLYASPLWSMIIHACPKQTKKKQFHFRNDTLG